MKPVLLSDQLTGSHGDQVSAMKYRAMLVEKGGNFLVSIEHCIRGNWSVCGRWNLNTLLFGYPLCLGNKPSDRLSIDHGQQWSVKGMHAALSEAINHI